MRFFPKITVNLRTGLVVWGNEAFGSLLVEAQGGGPNHPAKVKAPLKIREVLSDFPFYSPKRRPPTAKVGGSSSRLAP